MINESQASDIQARADALRAWMGKRNSYHPSELPTNLKPPSNEEISALEVYKFYTEKPQRYFAYVKLNEHSGLRGKITTWTGELLGTCELGHSYRDNFGGTRQSIRVRAINGLDYAGTYYRSSGDYCRIKARKTKGD